MSVTASFQPERLVAEPGQITSLSLHLQNDATAEQTVTLSAAGDLMNQTLLSTGTVRLDAGEHLEVPVLIDANGDLARGRHCCVVDVSADDQIISVTADVEIAGTSPWTATLSPRRSSSSKRGKHKVHIDNLSDTKLILSLTASSESDVEVELAAPTVAVDPDSTAKVALATYPHARYWTGDREDHPFDVTLTGDETTVTLDGVYQQQPRVARWVGPALAGMLGSLILGTIAWFALLVPAVENIATDTATELDTAQQEALDQRVAEIQSAAEEASSLPLGEPRDLRLSVSASPATTSTDAVDFDQAGTGRLLSISDVIFQNPTGAIGRLELLRDGEVLLDQEMANFRDLDFHLVAPFRVDSQSTIALRVTCETPGPGTDECEAAATIAGFVDQL